MNDVVIIDYGFCNLDSVYRAVQECGGNPVVSDNPNDARTAARMILPGVGSYAEAMKAMHALGWSEVIQEEAAKGIPLLGICLGMQMLGDSSTEGGLTQGLGLIPGKVEKFSFSDTLRRIPHMGWNEVHYRNPSPLFDGIPDGKNFYFVHSYRYLPEREEECLAVTPYGEEFACVVGRDNIVGTQFHPEKSLRTGFHLLRNFLENY